MSNCSFDKRALGQVIDQAMQQKALLFGTVADLTSSRASENEPIELDRIERLWGTEEYARLVLREASPSLADDERMVTWLASYTRRAASPGAAIALELMNHLMDASDILHAIHVPTLVIGRTGAGLTLD